MGSRSVGRWLTACLILAGCGSNPGGAELALDYAGGFAGTWFGSATYTYRQDGQTTTTDRPLQPLIVVTGKNALQLPAFCSASDPGVSATVTSPTHFDLKPYQCQVSDSGYCPFTVKVDHGGGDLAGATLHLDYHGTLEQPASAGCPAITVQYDLIFSGTHTPPSQQQPKPATPENVKVSKGDYYAVFNLSWTVSGPVGQIQVQARLGSGDWQDVGTLYSSSSAVSLNNPPERVPVAFRIRNTNGESSDWSAEVTENTGLYPPVVNSATGADGTIRLTWVPRQDVTGLIIERSTGQGMSDWTPLTTLAAGSSSYIDTQLAEFQFYAYRLRWVDGAVEGYRTALYPVNTGLLAPTGLAAVPGVERVDLTWQNRSTSATEIVVVRTLGLTPFSGTSEVAHLPPTATSFSDVGVATGLYRYEVDARAAGYSASSQSVPLATVPTSGSWETSVLEFPAGDLDLMGGAGIDDSTRVLAWSGSAGLVGSDSPAWLPHLPPNWGMFGMSPPTFELDASFHPHIVWMRSTVQGTSEAAVTHEWFDGNVWHSDELTRWQIGMWTHALDPTARPVVVTASTSGILALRWNGSAWVVENTGISIAQNTSLGAMQVAVSPEGVIHLVVQDTAGNVIHAWRTSSWNQEVVTLPSATEGLMQVAASTGDRVTVTFFDWMVPQAQIIEKSGGTWRAPVNAPSQNSFLNLLGLRLATSGAGAHPTLAIATPSGLQIARSTDGWALHPLTGVAAILGVGYDASDHLWVLVQGGWDGGPTSYLALFREK